MAHLCHIIWKVTQATDGQNGLVVRKGEDLDSPTEELQLSIGALLCQKERHLEELHYELVSGDGPQEGWVSIMNDELDLFAQRLGPKVVTGQPIFNAPLEKLKDPTYSDELQTSEIDVDGLKAIITCRTWGAPKAPLAFLMLPGNPVMDAWHASTPLPLAVEKALSKAGVPVVRFDWNGQGMNAFTGHPKTQMLDDKIPVAFAMYEVAKTLGEKIVLCTTNWSGCLIAQRIPVHGLVIDLMPEVVGLVSLCFAYKHWEEMKKSMPDWPQAGLDVKEQLESHSQIKVPAIYVFGSKDIFTPLEEVEQITRRRASDGGCGVEIYVVNQEEQKPTTQTRYMALKGREEEAGSVIATWVSDLREKLHVMESKIIGG